MSARLAGLGFAQGDYIIHVDGDDWIAENLLEELFHVIQDHHSPDIILYDALRVYADRQERILSYLSPGFYPREEMEKHIFPTFIYEPTLPFLTSKISGYLWCKAMKRKIAQEHICNDLAISKYEDFAGVYECIYFSKHFYYHNKPLYYYNKTNEESIMTAYDATYFRNLSRVMDYTSSHLGIYSDKIQQQIDASNVSGICIGIFHEVRHGRNLMEASKHIRKELTSTTCLSKANCKGLPLHAKFFIFLLKCKLYFPALLIAKIYLSIKRN